MYSPARSRRPPARRRPSPVAWGVLALLVVLAAVAYVVFTLVVRSVPAATVLVARRPPAFPGGRPALAWPRQGDAAVGVQGVGLIASHGSGRPGPIASVAKVMTAYVVLRDHPLHRGQSGPEITVSPQDAATYAADQRGGQSVVLVHPGERLSERQALEGLLLPSGNNIATLLARWDAGSERRFVAKMNATARAIGLPHTHYTDPSGLEASTVSTAGDQTRLGMRAMAVPALAQIVGMAQANLPVAGRQYNRNGLLGRDGIVGIKTGTTSEAGGCFLFAATDRVGGRTITIIGAVLHQPAAPAHPELITSAFAAGTALLGSARRVVIKRRVVRSGTTLGWTTAPWSDRVPLKATAPAMLIGWAGLRTRTRIVTAPGKARSAEAGELVRTAVIAAGAERDRVRIAPAGGPPGPSLVWRITHP